MPPSEPSSQVDLKVRLLPWEPNREDNGASVGEVLHGLLSWKPALTPTGAGHQLVEGLAQLGQGFKGAAGCYDRQHPLAGAIETGAKAPAA